MGARIVRNDATAARRRRNRRPPRRRDPHDRLGKFGEELANTRELVIGGLPLRILDLRRILESKRATGRTKDIAAIPALEEAIAALEAIEGGMGGQRL